MFRLSSTPKTGWWNDEKAREYEQACLHAADPYYKVRNTCSNKRPVIVLFSRFTKIIAFAVY